MPIDRAKLVKVMMMTESSNDGEVLNAIRMANAMLKANKLDWEKAIAGTSKVSDAYAAMRGAPQYRPPPRPPMKPAGRGTTDTMPEYPRPKSQYTDRNIPRMIESLLRDTKGDFRDMLQSFKQHWDAKHYLTERQYEVLFNAYERAK